MLTVSRSTPDDSDFKRGYYFRWPIFKFTVNFLNIDTQNQRLQPL